MPSHLREQLVEWMENAFEVLPYGRPRDDIMLRVAAALRVTPPSGYRGLSLYYNLVEWYQGDDDRFLDLIHTIIQTTQISCADLDLMLELGGSAWRATERGLQRRVTPTAQKAFESARSPADAASDELIEAWNSAYDRNPNASDAWDHAIKAVELVLIQIVVPNQNQPQIGHVIGQLDHQGQLWKLGLPGPKGNNSVEQLIGMLRLLWPNPDRHGNPHDRRTPTIQEARAVVALAVTIVQWGREGLISRR